MTTDPWSFRFSQADSPGESGIHLGRGANAPGQLRTRANAHAAQSDRPTTPEWTHEEGTTDAVASDRSDAHAGEPDPSATPERAPVVDEEPFDEEPFDKVRRVRRVTRAESFAPSPLARPPGGRARGRNTANTAGRRDTNSSRPPPASARSRASARPSPVPLLPGSAERRVGQSCRARRLP